MKIMITILLYKVITILLYKALNNELVQGFKPWTP